MTDTVRTEPQPEVALDAAEHILGANPFVGLNRRQIAAALGRWIGRLGLQPRDVAAEAGRLARELGRVTVGRSQVGPDRGDKRFADPAWTDNPAYHRLEQAYLAWRASTQRLVEAADLDWKSKERARFAAALLTEAVAPTNTLAGNPAALKRVLETGGLSLVRGARNLVGDLRHNGGMPSQVDARPYRVGENLAVTPGMVVHRSDLCEVIQYQPTTDTMYERPLVMIPPQINKYYVMDLAPGRSFFEYAVAQGIPFFAVSFRNPRPEHADWGLDAYVGACLEAVGVACEVTGSEDCNVFGLCAGGITMSLLLGHLAAVGDRRVRSASFAVTMLDTQAQSMIGMFASERSVSSSKARSESRGVLAGRDMAQIFAWLRPNDLVWNYWVNNYLLGNDPPAFDILYWNNDSTNLPRALHHEFLDLFLRNPLVEPGGATVLGTAIDLSKVDCDTYAVAGITDHIVPWKAAYRTTQLLGGDIRFVLSTSGHIQSLVNPPTNPKAAYRIADALPEDPDAWAARATEVRGSWWEDWATWVGERSGDRVAAPDRLGSDAHPPLAAAPGRYVLDRPEGAPWRT